MKTKEFTTVDGEPITLQYLEWNEVVSTMDIREKNLELTRKEGQDEECICCCKPMFITPSTTYIEMTTDAEFVQTHQHDLDNSQGCFPVGTECAKKFPKTFHIKFNE